VGPGPDQTEIDRAFAEAATEGIVIHRDGIVLAANEACCVLYGYVADEAVGRPITDFIAPEAQAEALERGREGVEQPYESLALHHDGSIFPVEFRGRAVTLDGRPARAVTIRDLTFRKRAERELHRMIDVLRENEERFRTIIEALPHIAFIVRPDGVAQYYNGRGAAYFGPLVMDSPGRLGFVHPDDRAGVVAARQAAVAASREFEIEIRLRRQDDTYRWHRFRSIPLFRDGKLDAYLSTAIDIDELRRANEMLEQRVAERTAQLTASETQIRLFYEHA
jgi:PAS domain S-box-containing protein